MSNTTTNSCIHEVETAVGTFTVHFPCAVFTKESMFNSIPEAIRNFEFLPTPEDADSAEKSKIADMNMTALQNALNKAICFGTNIPQGRVSINWYSKEVVVM